MRNRRMVVAASIVVALLVVVGAHAVEIWTKTYGDGLDDMAFDVLLLEDGGYLLAVESVFQYEPMMLSRAVLLRLDEDGEVVWERTYGGERAGALHSLLHHEDGGFVAAGAIQSEDGDDAEAYLLRVDADGTEIWSASFGTQLMKTSTRFVSLRMADSSSSEMPSIRTTSLPIRGPRDTQGTRGEATSTS